MRTYREADPWNAIADATRRAIVERLAVTPCAVGELARDLPVSRPAVSQHLKVLKSAGLVTDRAVGTRRVYQLDPAGIQALRDDLDRFWTGALVGFKRVVERSRGGNMTEPVRRHILVDAPVERAFTVFTAQFGDFKPREHNLLQVPIAETVFEPRVGGRIYDVGTDGSRCEWARVLVFEPPSRVVFSWDIGPTWQVESDPAKTSEVEVRFIAEAPDRTRVELEHRHLGRHGDGWASVADGVGGDAGWPLYLQRFAELVAR